MLCWQKKDFWRVAFHFAMQFATTVRVHVYTGCIVFLKSVEALLIACRGDGGYQVSGVAKEALLVKLSNPTCRNTRTDCVCIHSWCASSFEMFCRQLVGLECNVSVFLT